MSPPLPPDWTPGRGETAAREVLAELGRHLYRSGAIRGTAGNVSVRLESGRLLVSPRGRNLARLGPADFVRVEIGSAPPPEATSELPMHVSCYAADPESCAVLHTHAPHLTALGLGTAELDDALPELALALGGVTRVPFLPSGGRELAGAVGRAVADGAGLLLLERHGVVTLGRSLGQAVDRLELGELSARAVLAASREPV